MRDYRKYCRPKVQKNPKIGDVRVRLNCGEILTVSAYDYKKVGRNFKLDSFIGESPNTAGNLLVTNKILNQDMVLSPLDYVDNSDRFEIKEIIGDSTSDAQEGDIMCHNSLLDTDAVFSFNDWKNNVSDDWDLVGLYGITTYEEEDAANGDYVIMANGHTLIIKPEDYSKISDNWELVDTISKGPVYEAIDLGLPSGTLWADRNVGATAPEDYGSYFSWGNIEGHAEGSGYNFDSSTYNNTTAASISANLSPSQDAACANMGGNWRMPTKEETKELYDNTDTEWTTIDGVAGRKFMKKSDHSVYIFLPAAGRYDGTSLSGRGSYGRFWSASFYSRSTAYDLYFDSSSVSPQNYYDSRYFGFSVRAVQ